MKKMSRIITVIAFLGIIFTFPILTYVKEKEDISQFENRKLEEVPKVSKESVVNGEYFKGWEKYMADHIYGRNQWLKAYIDINMNALGKLKINDIVIGEEDTILPFNPYIGKKTIYQNEKDIAEITDRLEKLKESLEGYGGDLYFVGVPVQQSFYIDRYPKYFEKNREFLEASEEIVFSSLAEKEINSIKMSEIFKAEYRDDYYFKTDHHYNFEGYYRTYMEIMDRVKENEHNVGSYLKREELDIAELPQEFRGSRNRQIYYMHPTDEKLKIGKPKQEIPYEKLTDGKLDHEIYHNEGGSDYVEYGIFMGGDKAEIEIYTDRPELPNLLIVGDSFTNAIETLMYYHFNETRVLDYRYYSEMDIYDYVEKHKPDVVVYVRDNANYGNLEGNGSFGIDRKPATED